MKMCISSVWIRVEIVGFGQWFNSRWRLRENMCIRTVCISVSAMLGDSSLCLGFLVCGAEPRVNYGCSVGVPNALHVQSCLPGRQGSASLFSHLRGCLARVQL